MTKNQMKILIDNIKYFLFLKSFCLIIKDKSLIENQYLLNLISNLSKLKLIENIKIAILDIINITEEDEKRILNQIRNIKKEKKFYIIELDGEIFNEPRYKRFKTFSSIISELFSE